MQDKKEQNGAPHKVLTVLGIVLCVILIPILIINCTLLVKGFVKDDEVPDFGGFMPLIVLTKSMEEDFPGGSLIVSRVTDAEEIAVGDIISYFDPASKTGAVVTHRVAFIKETDGGKTVFYTYGTANTNKTLEEITESDCEQIPAENLVGRYTGFHINGAGSVAMFMQSTPGLILCIAVPLVALFGYDFIRRKLYEKKTAGDKDELMKELEELRRLKEMSLQSEELRVESGDESITKVE